MTMSTSSAPSAIACFVSNALTAEGVAPCGKPMTVHVFTPVSRSASDTKDTQIGLTQTEAK